ncbi:hypothetical protein C8R44DRAFT_865253 [Mycena epipterygia]|nr:hypothetical protein C8R44DRAFT_865253 [Mycena epipterygia]
MLTAVVVAGTVTAYGYSTHAPTSPPAAAASSKKSSKRKSAAASAAPSAAASVSDAAALAPPTESTSGKKAKSKPKSKAKSGAALLSASASASAHPQMRMRVDEAGGYPFPSGIDNVEVVWEHDVGGDVSHGDDDALIEQHVAEDYLRPVPRAGQNLRVPD